MLNDGTLANGAFALRETYSSLSKALPQISYYAGTAKLKVFMSGVPGQRFSQTEDVNGSRVIVTGESDGKAIVIHLSAHNFLLVGYRASVSFGDPAFRWPELRNIRAEKVYWAGDRWNEDGELTYGVDQSKKALNIELESAEAVRVSW